MKVSIFTAVCLILVMVGCGASQVSPNHPPVLYTPPSDGPMPPKGDTGETGPKGDKGDTGSNGIDGVDGKNPFLPAQTLTLTASRTYGPSDWNPAFSDVAAGFYSVPTSLPIVSGAGGTGWAFIQIGVTRFCYQANGVNNSDAGTKFVLKGFNIESDCSSGGLNFVFGDIFIASDSTVTLNVSGGGLHSSLQGQGTEISAQISVLPLNN